MSPDGKLLASGGPDNDISLWEAATGELVRRLEGHTETIASSAGLAFSPSGERLASASLDNTARLWDVATGTSLRVLSGHDDTVEGVAFSPDGRHVATSSQDRRVVLWAVDSGRAVQVFTGHENEVYGLAFVPRDPGQDRIDGAEHFYIVMEYTGGGSGRHIRKRWSGRRDSNSRPSAWEAGR